MFEIFFIAIEFFSNQIGYRKQFIDKHVKRFWTNFIMKPRP